MRALVLGDPHGEVPKNLDTIVRRNKIEIILCTGDFAFIPKQPWIKEEWEGVTKEFVDKTYREVVDKICSYGLPVITLRGNMLQTGKRKKDADRILRKHKNLVNKFLGKHTWRKKTFIFFEVVYENSTVKKDDRKKPFFRQQMRRSASQEKRLRRLLRENPQSILLCHNPPYGLVDEAFNGEHVGSKIIRRAIETYPPSLVLCGHIHEAKGEATLGKTKVYNLGSHGSYKILEI